MSKLKSIQSSAQPSQIRYQHVLATVEKIDEHGCAFINLASSNIDSPGELIKAEVGLSQNDMSQLIDVPVKVVVLISTDETEAPVITALVRQNLPIQRADSTRFLNGVDVKVDGRQIKLNAKEEVLLECGKSSIRLTREGKVVIKGTQVVSRASGSNKVKGSTVNIN